MLSRGRSKCDGLYLKTAGLKGGRPGGIILRSSKDELVAQTSGDTSYRNCQITFGLAALISVLYVAFCAHLPISLLANHIRDEALFVSHGRLLAHGHWLGPFSEFTLMRGPGYPAFLAISAWTGLPISITQSLFNCVAVGALSFVIWRLGGSRMLAVATFVAVLWDPGLVQQRAVRDAIYPGQLLLFIAAFSFALFCVTRPGQVVSRLRKRSAAPGARNRGTSRCWRRNGARRIARSREKQNPRAWFQATANSYSSDNTRVV
jgi:hypothetical protein